MAYQCPRCGDPVQRAYSGSAQMAAGLVGALFYAAVGSFQCSKCGKISRSEFPSRVQVKMGLWSLFMAAGAIMIAFLCLSLIK